MPCSRKYITTSDRICAQICTLKWAELNWINSFFLDMSTSAKKYYVYPSLTVWSSGYQWTTTLKAHLLLTYNIFRQYSSTNVNTSALNTLCDKKKRKQNKTCLTMGSPIVALIYSDLPDCATG